MTYRRKLLGIIFGLTGIVLCLTAPSLANPKISHPPSALTYYFHPPGEINKYTTAPLAYPVTVEIVAGKPARSAW